VARAVAEQMAVTSTSSDNPALVEMIRMAVNDALDARGAQIGQIEPEGAPSSVAPTTAATPRP
jgi:hypothetical protein